MYCCCGCGVVVLCATLADGDGCLGCVVLQLCMSLGCELPFHDIAAAFTQFKLASGGPQEFFPVLCHIGGDSA